MMNNFDQGIHNRNNKIVEQIGTASLVKQYIAIRTRQLLVASQLSIQLILLMIAELKSGLVRNMYWGRTSFYKTAFHLLIVFITLLAFSSGLSSKLVMLQSDQIQNFSTSQLVIDSDLVSQRGSFFPIEELNGDFDSVYQDYTVQQGDTLSKIASDNHLTTDTIKWANNITSDKISISVGQTLRIPIINGVLYIVKSGDTVDSILNKLQLTNKEANKFDLLELNVRSGGIDNNGNLIVGKTIFVPDASLPAPKITTSRPRTTKVSTKPVVNVPAGTFVNPLQLHPGYSFVRGYSSRHTGVDLATPRGTWVVAAGSGQVIRAGWCPGGLGWCVVIKHANGYSTVYGHGNGVIAVSSGQGVQAGQRILQTGCTGNCGGPHLHLSLAANGDDVYNCYYCRINPKGIIPY